jgi:hypothetical protein
MVFTSENDLYEEFQRCGVQFYDQKPGEAEWDWDWYFLIQHHGAATRLLDWSDGALIALHFALRDKNDGNPEDAFVYVLEPDGLRDHLNAFGPFLLEDDTVLAEGRLNVSHFRHETIALYGLEHPILYGIHVRGL